jgi:hypothetical protein
MEHKRDLVSYLEATSQHSFVNPNGTFFAVREKDGRYYQIDGTRVTELSPETLFGYYKENSKCVMAHRLFLNRERKSIKHCKAIREWLETVFD